MQVNAVNKVNYTIDEDISYRITIMRGILTLMVVNIHSVNMVVHFQSGDVSWGNTLWLEWVEYYFSYVVSRAAVPAFFFISSLLLYRKEFSWKENVRKRIRSLMIPYVIVNSFWIGVYFVLQSIPSLSTYFTMEGFIVRNWGIVQWLNAYGLFSVPLVAPLWFIRDLFVLNILAIVIKRVVDFCPKICLTSTVVFWISPFETHIFCLDKQALCFWIIGYICILYRYDLRKLLSLKSYCFFCTYVFITVIDAFSRDYAFNWIIHNCGIFIGVIFWFIYGTSVRGKSIKKILLFVSEYSFGVYLFHQLTLNCINKVYARVVVPGSVTQLIGYVVIPLIVILGCLAFSVFLKRKIPSGYCILFGKSLRTIKKNDL